MGRRGTIALVLLFAWGVCTSTASADPLSMEFTEARANVGVQLSDEALFEAPDTAPLAGEIDPASGAITNGVLQVPQFSTHITDPLDADVTVDFEIGVITGSFNASAGALTLQGVAEGTLTADGKKCAVSTVPPVLTLSTSGSSGGESPRSGEPFTAGLGGPGAIAGQWIDMNATPVNPPDGEVVCEVVDERIGGPGGIWLEQVREVVPKPSPSPPPPPRPPICIVPKLAGKTMARARAALKAAHCTVGKVHRQKRPQGRALGVFVVKKSRPGAGAKPANGRVHLKLGPKHR